MRDKARLSVKLKKNLSAGFAVFSIGADSLDTRNNCRIRSTVAAAWLEKFSN